MTGRVLVVGAGGLGAPALISLASRGVDWITVMDPDRVEESNLHRQILYGEADVGAPKVEVAALALSVRFGVRVEARMEAFRAEARGVVAEHDVVLDATDGFETKLALNDACVDHAVPYVFGGVVGYEGQVMAVRPGHACLRCLFEDAPPPGAAPTCTELGILGPIAGIVAARQAALACAALSAEPLGADRIWLYDGRRDRAREVELRRMPDCRGCGPNQHLRGVLVAGCASDGANRPEGSISARELDLVGLTCPHTYTRTNRALSDLEAGDRLWVLLSSDEAARNVPRSVIAAGHRVLVQRSDGQVHRVLIERGEGERFHDDYGSNSNAPSEVHRR